jgi:hypothetical protein
MKVKKLTIDKYAGREPPRQFRRIDHVSEAAGVKIFSFLLLLKTFAHEFTMLMRVYTKNGMTQALF